MFGLRPVGEDGHDASAKGDAAKAKELHLERGAAHVGVEHELVGKELDETSVHEDTSADGIKDTVGKLLVGCILGLGAHAGGDADGGREGKAESEDIRKPLLALGPGGGGKTGAETETLKHLVEDENDEENDKVVGGTKGKTNKDTVENDTKLENKDGSELAADATLALLVGTSVRKVVLATRRVANVIRTAGDALGVDAGGLLQIRSVGAVLRRLLARRLLGNKVQGGRVAVRGVAAAVLVVLLEAGDDKLDEEHGHDSHETDGKSPRVFGDALSDTLIAKVVDGRVEQMHPGSGDDNTGTDILADEKGKLGDVHSRLAGQEDGSQGANSGGDQDDEDGANAEALASVVDGLAVAVLGFFVGHGELMCVCVWMSVECVLRER